MAKALRSELCFQTAGTPGLSLGARAPQGGSGPVSERPRVDIGPGSDKWEPRSRASKSRTPRNAEGFAGWPKGST